MKRIALALVATTLLTAATRAEVKPVAKIVPQPSAPVLITTYSAVYSERSQYSTEGIRHVLQFQNKGEKEIAAVQVGLIAFDVWNEFLNRTAGLSLATIPPGKSDKGVWVATTYSGFSFMTGVAYVNQVRFADGEIWKADEDEILSELKKIQKDFDVKNLTKIETAK